MQMGNDFFGMDVEGIQKVSGSIDVEASHIQSILTSLTRTLSSTPWTGPDRDRFVQEWQDTHVPAIKKAVADLHEVSSNVKTSIQLQINASGH